MIDRLAQKEGEMRDCSLAIHFTARLIFKDDGHQLRCGFFKRYKPDTNETPNRWVPQEFDLSSETASPTSLFREESLSRVERDLYRKWLGQAKYWRQYEENLKDGGRPDAELDEDLASESSSDSGSSEATRGSNSESNSEYGDTPGNEAYRGLINWPEVITRLDLGYVPGCEKKKSLIYLIRSELRELRRRERHEYGE